MTGPSFFFLWFKIYKEIKLSFVFDGVLDLIGFGFKSAASEPIFPNLISGRTRSGESSMAKLSESTALILIDVQRAFPNTRWGERNNPEAEANIGRLLAGWRNSRRQIRHMVHDSLEPSSLLRPESPRNAIQAVAAPKANEPVYRKHVNSAVIGTDLEQDLRRGGIETLVMAGLTTKHCVSTTARMAGNLSFRTFIVSDATAASARPALDGTLHPAKAVYSAALSDFHQELAAVVDTAEIFNRAEG